MLEITSLGALIIQYGKPISFYIRKLTETQTEHTVTEKEWLSVVETLKNFWTILLGQQLEIYTNNKNLTCKNFNTDRLLQCILITE